MPNFPPSLFSKFPIFLFPNPLYAHLAVQLHFILFSRFSCRATPQSKLNMGAYEPRDLTSPEKLTFFVPSTNPQVPVIGMTSRRNDWPGADLDPDDFEIDDLLLMQDPDGCYWWAFFDSIFEQDSKMYLHRCALNHVEADSIVRRRVLFVSDNDSRLSDFTLLCQHGKPPTADKTSDKFDVAARHLASTREVHIFSIGPDGKKACDEIKTADYCRAKADIRRNPADMRNMRRFCNRQWNGEGPSNLNRRICHGYVPPRTRWSPSSSPEASRTPSLNYFSSSDMPYIEIPTPEQRHRRHSTTYYIMKRTLVPNTKLKAHQYNYDLKHARREKKPEEYLPPSRWSAVVKRIWRFCRSAQRRLFVEATSASAHLKGKRRPGARYESQKHPSPPPPDHPSSNKSYERSTSPTLVDDEDISPFTLGAPAMEHAALGREG